MKQVEWLTDGYVAQAPVPLLRRQQLFAGLITFSSKDSELHACWMLNLETMKNLFAKLSSSLGDSSAMKKWALSASFAVTESLKTAVLGFGNIALQWRSD